MSGASGKKDGRHTKRTDGTPAEDFLNHGPYIVQVLPVFERRQPVPAHDGVKFCLSLTHDIRVK